MIKKVCLIILVILLLANISLSKEFDVDYCNSLGISIIGCSTDQNGLFKADFNVKGTDTGYNGILLDINQAVDYNLEAENRYTDFKNNTLQKGSLPKGYTLNKLGNNRYTIEYQFENNNITSFKVQYTKTNGDYIYYWNIKDCYTFMLIDDYNYNFSLTDYEKCDYVINKPVSSPKKEEPELVEVPQQEEIKEVPKESKSYFGYIIVAISIIIAAVIIAFSLRKRKY